jgi:hypothetical protein
MSVASQPFVFTRSSTPESSMATRHASQSRKDTLGFKLIFVVTFLTFFGVAVIDRLVPLRWVMGLAKSENYMAIFAEAKLAAATYTPFAFMG